MDPSAIPDGFERLDRMGRFLDHFGPVYTRRAGDAVIVAVHVEEKHLNVRGLAHGGMLVSLADSALGINLSHLADPPRPMVTVNLSSDFLAPARLGDWIEAHVTVQKRGARLAFASCNLMVRGKSILRTSGVFAVVGGAAGNRPSERFDG